MALHGPKQIRFISTAPPGSPVLFLLFDQSLMQLSLSTCPFYIFKAIFLSLKDHTRL